jgi:hypothetical protein
MQAGNGTSNSGPNNQQQLVGGIGSGVSYDWAFRAFAQSTTYHFFPQLLTHQHSALWIDYSRNSCRIGFVGSD